MLKQLVDVQLIIFSRNVMSKEDDVYNQAFKLFEYKKNYDPNIFLISALIISSQQM
jgi:hypothetical protein